MPGSRGGAGEEARRPGADTSPTSPCRRGGLQLLLSVAASLAAPLPFREGMTKKNFVFGVANSRELQLEDDSKREESVRVMGTA